MPAYLRSVNGRYLDESGNEWIPRRVSSDGDELVPAPGVGGLDLSTLVGCCRRVNDAWTYGGAIITLRPSWPGLLLWAGGEADADPTPEGLAIAAEDDIWVPSGLVD